MPVTALIIRNPTNTRAGAVAKPGIEMKRGEKIRDMRKRSPVTTEERPVRPPAETPEELSTKVVVVEVPRTAPAVVAIASARSAGRIRGSFPSLSSISALSAHPMSVPRVSKTSTKRNANMITMKSRTLKLAKAASEKHAPKVCPMDAKEKSAKPEGSVE